MFPPGHPGLFEEHLDVTADALDARVKGERNLERRRQNEQWYEREEGRRGHGRASQRNSGLAEGADKDYPDARGAAFADCRAKSVVFIEISRRHGFCHYRADLRWPIRRISARNGRNSRLRAWHEVGKGSARERDRK